jgi:hypothetical protein
MTFDEDGNNTSNKCNLDINLLNGTRLSASRPRLALVLAFRALKLKGPRHFQTWFLCASSAGASSGSFDSFVGTSEKGTEYELEFEDEYDSH